MKITTHRELEVYEKAFAVKCDYVDRNEAAKLYKTYDEVIGTFVGMINHKEKWVFPSKK
jgi:hypothetical protein